MRSRQPHVQWHQAGLEAEPGQRQQESCVPPGTGHEVRARGDQVELQSTDEVFERLGTDDLSQVPSDSKAAGAVTSCEMSAQECQTGLVTGPGGAKFGPSGFVVNCPLISIDIP